MSRWEEKRLGELIDINPEALAVTRHKGSIEYIDIASVSNGKLAGYTTYDITEAPSRARRVIKDNDVIFSTVRPNLKAYYYVKNSPPNAICSTGFVVLRAKSGVNSRFIYSLVTENSFINYLALVAKGSAYPAVDANDFKRAKVHVPDIFKQNRIADILSAYDDLIEANNRRIELLEQAAQELYKEWFVRLRFPGHEKAKFENGLPEGWTIKRIGDLFTITSSKRVYLADYVENGIPFYRSKEIIQLSQGQTITEPLYISHDAFENFKNKFGVPEKNDILITSVGTVGISYLVDGHEFYFKDGNLTWIKSGSDKTLSFFLFQWLNSQGGKQRMLQSTIGTSQSALTIENLKKIKLIIPNRELVESYYSKTYAMTEKKRILQLNNQNLAAQRDLLLPRLMSGKLEV